nr:relaxosome protein [Serratia entomophila]
MHKFKGKHRGTLAMYTVGGAYCIIAVPKGKSPFESPDAAEFYEHGIDAQIMEPLRVMKESTKEKSKSVVFSLRVPESDAEQYDAMCKDANLSRSDLLRAIIKTKTNGGDIVINAPQKKVKNPDFSKLVFYITNLATTLTS